MEALQRYQEHERSAIVEQYERLGCRDIPVQRLAPTINDARAVQMRALRSACAEGSMAVAHLDYLASNYADCLVVLHYM